ncbi:MAG: HPr family phosphocarrier protein [Pseudomonadota bacterium]
MIRRDIEIVNKLGLHARAASKLVALTGRFSATITLGRTGQKPVDAKSIMAMLMLAANKGTVLVLECDGSDEQEAADAVCALVTDFFGEGE